MIKKDKYMKNKHDNKNHKLLVQQANGELVSASEHAVSIHNVEEKVEENKDSTTRGVTVVKKPMSYPTVLDQESRSLEVDDWTDIEWDEYIPLQPHSWFSYLWLIFTLDFVRAFALNFRREHFIQKVPTDMLSAMRIWWLTKTNNSMFLEETFVESLKFAIYYMTFVLNVKSADISFIARGVSLIILREESVTLPALWATRSRILNLNEQTYYWRTLFCKLMYTLMTLSIISVYWVPIMQVSIILAVLCISVHLTVRSN